MRNVSSPVRAVPHGPRRQSRSAAAIVKSVRHGGGMVLLVILFWAIFYQNLPDNFGLNGPVIRGDATSANVVDRVIKICTLLVSIYVIVTRWSLTRSLVKYINVGAAAVLGLAALSAIWSINSNATILRFVSLATIVLICLANSIAGWNRLRFQQLALPPLMYILVVSLVLGIIFPDRIVEIGDDISLRGSWHGITLTKNQFGMTASLAAIICINRWLAREGRTAWYVVGTVVAVACLILSRSNTSLIATMIGVLFMVLAMKVPAIKQRHTTLVVVAMAATVLMYELVTQDILPGAHTLLAPVRLLTGKDSTFSARTEIWDIIKQHIDYSPYLGSGYGAYWVLEKTSPSWVFIYVMYFYPTEAHNGYLDIINDLGYVGLVLLFAFLFWYMRQAVQLMRVDRSQATLYLALLLQMMVLNMSESEWFARDSAFAVIILAINCLSRQVFESRPQAQPAAQPVDVASGPHGGPRRQIISRARF